MESVANVFQITNQRIDPAPALLADRELNAGTTDRFLWRRFQSADADAGGHGSATRAGPTEKRGQMPKKPAKNWQSASKSLYLANLNGAIRDVRPAPLQTTFKNGIQ